MKKTTLFALICATALPAFASDNLITNGDFEDDTKITKSGLPAGVRTWTDQAEFPGVIQLSQDEKVSGNNSLHMERTSLEGTLSFGLPRIQVEPGRKYQFSCMVKMTDGTVDIVFSLLDNGNQHIHRPLDDAQTTTEGAKATQNGVSLSYKAMANPDEFTKLDLTFSIPEGVYFLGINGRLKNNVGKAWFDDFEIVPVD